MKKLFFLLLLSTAALAVRAMSFSEAQRHALFLSDKMAYELGLTERQYEAVYEINLDYLLSVERGSVYGEWWRRRNVEMRRILNSGQYLEYERAYRFYRPVHWKDGAWHYGVYGYYTDYSRMYRPRPRVYASYRGGRHFGPHPGPRPHHVTPAPPRPNRYVPGPRPNPNRVAPRPNPAPRPNGYRQGAAPRSNGFRQNTQPRRDARPQPNAAPRNQYRQDQYRRDNRDSRYNRDNRDRRDGRDARARSYDRRYDRR